MSVDVTEKTFKATHALTAGKMISSSAFSLDDAMSAIELMEPKMDPGFNIENKQLILSASRDRIHSMLLTEAAIQQASDVLLGLVMNWLKGDLYIQSVHASMFMTERESLPNRDIGRYCTNVLRLCKVFKALVSTSGLTDEEDFVGYMFGFDGEADITEKVEQAPKLSQGCLEERGALINDLSQLFSPGPRSLKADSLLLEKIIKSLDNLSTTSSTDSLTSEEISLINSSIDPSMHRNLLPPGPPRNVVIRSRSDDIFSQWLSLMTGIRDCAEILRSIELESETLSPFDLLIVLTEVRRHPTFNSVLLRAYLYNRLVAVFKPLPVLRSWLPAFCGGSLTIFHKISKEETEAFVSDSALVLQRIVYTLFRSPSRQHRSLKSNLTDLCVMQHRAWNLHSKCHQQAHSRGLWMYTCAVACSLIQLNLLLAIELNLVDFETIELPLVLFLMETAASMKVYLLNDAMGTVRTSRGVDPVIARAIQCETVISALEQSLIDTTLKTAMKIAQSKGLKDKISQEQQERLFELRSIPFQVFPLPKTISLDEFLEKLDSGLIDVGADDCLGWIDKVTQLIPKVRGVVLGSDLSLAKKTVLNNKLMLMKANESARLVIKYHWTMPCVVLG